MNEWCYHHKIVGFALRICAREEFEKKTLCKDCLKEIDPFIFDHVSGFFCIFWPKSNKDQPTSVMVWRGQRGRACHLLWRQRDCARPEAAGGRAYFGGLIFSSSLYSTTYHLFCIKAGRFVRLTNRPPALTFTHSFIKSSCCCSYHHVCLYE